MSDYREVNFDGLPGPTHNYAGLSEGNLASTRHKDLVSSPRAAALQGLGKMRMLHELGYLQGIIPPQERPSLRALRSFGFVGPAASIIETAWRKAPSLASACSSSSSMWAANSATIAPSCDTGDGRCHITVANLQSKLHRNIEAAETALILKGMFCKEDHFAHHPPLPGGSAMSDEGAANHTRLARRYGESGLHIFVYGKGEQASGLPSPTRFTARQTLEASQAVARLNQIEPGHAIFLQQSPEAIDSGAFHNDVVAVGNLSVLLIHGQALVNQAHALEELQILAAAKLGQKLQVVEAPPERISLGRAVNTYLFNSQLLEFEGGQMLLAPAECAEDPVVREYLDELVDDPQAPIGRVIYSDVRESMQNGGGPACLRLRLVLSKEERTAISARIILNDPLICKLEKWVKRHYRETLHPEDLRDPQLHGESCQALDELTSILRLGSVYSFQ